MFDTNSKIVKMFRSIGDAITPGCTTSNMMNYRTAKFQKEYFPSQSVLAHWKRANNASFIESDWPFMAGVEGIYDLLTAKAGFNEFSHTNPSGFEVYCPSKLAHSVYLSWREIDPQGMSHSFEQLLNLEYATTEFDASSLTFNSDATQCSDETVIATWVALCKFEGLNPIAPGVLPFIYQIDEVTKWKNGVIYRFANGSPIELNRLSFIQNDMEKSKNVLPLMAIKNGSGAIAMTREAVDNFIKSGNLNHLLTQELVRVNTSRSSPAEYGQLNLHQHPNM